MARQRSDHAALVYPGRRGQYTRRKRLRIALHVATGLLALSATPPVTADFSGAQPSRTTAQWQLAKSSHSSKHTDADLDSDLETPSARTKGSRSGGYKSPSGGYDPKRIKRFWSHYHGERQEPKSKPLEHPN